MPGEQNLYREIIENSAVAIVLLDENANIMLVNEAMCEVTGYTQEELLGTSWFDKLPVEELERVRTFNRRRIQGDPNIPNKYESKYITKQNQIRSALFSVSLIDSNKKTVVTFIDNEEKRRTEEELKNSEERFRSIVEYANDLVYTLSKEGVFTYVSPNWQAVLGYKVNEVLGASFETLVHPDDIDRLKKIVADSYQNNKKYTGVEYRVKLKNGSWRWHVSNTSTVINDGKVSAMIGIARDITDQKNAEQKVRDNQIKLNLALKIARLGSWELNLEENLFHFNDTFYSIFKTSTEEVGTNTMSPQEYANRFVHPEDRYLVFQEANTAFHAQDPNYTCHIEHRMLYANGETGYIAVRFGILKDCDGKTVKLYGINQDITAIREAANKLRDSEARLQELNQMKDKFFSIIAHDLKNPFSTIVGFSELLLTKAKETNDKNVEKYANYVLQASENAMGLLTNLLEWTRNESGHMEFAPENIELLSVVNANLELLKPAAAQKNVDLEVNLPSDVMVFADQSMLNTIFRNLLTNALKFTYKEGKITVSVKEKASEIVICVADSGKGMSAAVINRLFLFKEKVSSKGTDNEEGTGLGLVLCKEFVEKHSGKIWVNSEVGNGSQFYFSLPKKRD